MTPFPVSYSSVSDFLAGYGSVPDGDGGNATSISAVDWLDQYFSYRAEVTAAVLHILEHGNDPYLQYFMTEAEISTFSIADFSDIVPADHDSLVHQTIVIVGEASMDAAHFNAIIDNIVYFAQPSLITVTDTAANIAFMQQHLVEMQSKYWMLGANATVTAHVVDASSALQSLTLGAIRDLVEGGVTHVDVTDNEIELNLAQYRALTSITFAEEDRHIVRGTTEDDHCLASAQWTRLHGARGDDRLELGSGGGEIRGGRGRDILVGGDGADVFAFTKIADSAPRNDRADVIGEFGEGDVFSLSFLDGIDGRPALKWIGEAAFTSTAGEVRFETSEDGLVVRVDSDGDSEADFSIVCRGLAVLSASDFSA